jgi:hypothetical protein
LAHIVGACGIFAALGADWIAERGLTTAPTRAELRGAAQVMALQARLGIPSVILLLLSGIYMATVTHLWQAPWVLAGVGAMVAIALTGGLLTGRTMARLGRETAALEAGPLPDALPKYAGTLNRSLKIRTVLAFGALVLMVLKPDALGTLSIVTAIGAIAGALAFTPSRTAHSVKA